MPLLELLGIKALLLLDTINTLQEKNNTFNKIV